MLALDAAGERAAALQHARVHEALLHEELGIAPDPAVSELVERLRAVEPRALPTSATSSAPSKPGVLVVPAGVDDLSAPLVVAAPATGSPLAPAVASSGAPAATSIESVPTVANGRRRVWSRWLAIAAAVSILSFALMRFLPIAHRGEAAAPGTRRVAVLPFANLSPDRSDECFSDGITEELISTLGRVEGVDVASRTSSFAFKSRQADVREVGRLLGVSTIVEGSVRRSGTMLRITARLVDARNGRQIWSQEYARQMDDALVIQEELSRAIVSNLTGTLLGAARTRFAERPTRDPAAYDLYLKGRYAWHQRTPEGLAQSIAYLEQAVQRAPDFARAYSGLADAYAVGAFYDYLAPRQAYPKAEAAARNALRTDPTLAAPHATLGYVLTYYHLDFDAAEAEFKRAIALDPSYSTAHQWYANLLTVAGRFAEAEREMRSAQEVDPLSLIAHAALGWSYYLGGKHEAALEQARKTLAMNADFTLASLWGAWALEALGRNRESETWLSEAVGRSKGALLPRLALARVQALPDSPRGRTLARETAAEMERGHATGEHLPAYEVGKLYLALGEESRAFVWLERAFDQRSHSRAIALVDPQLAPVRADPRLVRLMRGAISTGTFGAR